MITTSVPKIATRQKKEGAMRMRVMLQTALFFVAALYAGSASAGDLDKGFARAVAEGDIQLLKTLIDQGADVNAKNKEGETALMVASLEGRLDVAKLLVEKGADVNAKDSVGANALHYAAMGGSLDVIKYLVMKGADAQAKTEYGDTAAAISEMKGHRAAVDFLKSKR
jgi:ankyrin repeat protein